MRTIPIEPLTVEAFLPFGFFAGMLNPVAEKFGAPPIEFFRDMQQQNLGDFSLASFSTCRVAPREPVIDASEFHSTLSESQLPLDGDVLIHVGPATADAKPALDHFRVFRVPRGTLVTLRPGVWHHAPFTVGSSPVNVLIVLPERAYANDCTVAALAGSERLRVGS
jgi:ureidoglycolate lyase